METVLGHARLGEEPAAAHENLSALDVGPDAAARDDLERVSLCDRETATPGTPDDRLPEGLLAASLRRCDEPQELLLGYPVNDDHVGQLGLAPGEGAGLVEHH